jgi:DNA-binding MarR family transcriptional regulator
MNKAGASAEDNEEIWKRRCFFQLLRTSDIFKKYVNVILRRYGTNRIRFDILSILAKYKSLTPTALSKKLYRSGNSITSVLDTLEYQGLISRELSSKERRSFNITLTKKGLENYVRNMPYAQRFIREIMLCLNVEQTEELYALLSTLREHLLNLIDEGARSLEGKLERTPETGHKG